MHLCLPPPIPTSWNLCCPQMLLSSQFSPTLLHLEETISCRTLPPPKEGLGKIMLSIFINPFSVQKHPSVQIAIEIYSFFFLQRKITGKPVIILTPTPANILFFPTGNTNRRKAIRGTSPHNYNSILGFLLAQHFTSTKEPENKHIPNSTYSWHTSTATFCKIYLLFAACSSLSLSLKFLM